MLLQACAQNSCAPSSNIELIMQGLIALFLAILFLQSGFDKMNDRKGNLSWLQGHFANSPLKNMVPAMLGLITIMELAAGLLCVSGVISLVWKQCDYWIFWGCLLSAVSLISLFFGQRMAKDYAGALGLVPYFIVTLIGLWLCM